MMMAMMLVDVDDVDDDVDVKFLYSQHHVDVKRDFVIAVRRQLQRDFSQQRLLTVALNVKRIKYQITIYQNVTYCFEIQSDFATCARGTSTWCRGDVERQCAARFNCASNR
jgi:hypothetical protein